MKKNIRYVATCPCCDQVVLKTEEFELKEVNLIEEFFDIYGLKHEKLLGANVSGRLMLFDHNGNEYEIYDLTAREQEMFLEKREQ